MKRIVLKPKLSVGQKVKFLEAEYVVDRIDHHTNSYILKDKKDLQKFKVYFFEIKDIIESPEEQDHLTQYNQRKEAVWDAVRLADHEYDEGNIPAISRAEHIGHRALNALNGQEKKLGQVADAGEETKAERINKFSSDPDLNNNRSAFMLLNKALQRDSEYAWSWHCNIAGNIEWEGIDPIKANKIAARLMMYLFDVDITQHPAYPKEQVADAGKVVEDAQPEECQCEGGFNVHQLNCGQCNKLRPVVLSKNSTCYVAPNYVAPKQEGSPFKVGENISFWQEGQRRTGNIISEANKSGLMLVRTSGVDFIVHYKQCEVGNDRD